MSSNAVAVAAPDSIVGALDGLEASIRKFPIVQGDGISSGAAAAAVAAYVARSAGSSVAAGSATIEDRTGARPSAIYGFLTRKTLPVSAKGPAIPSWRRHIFVLSDGVLFMFRRSAGAEPPLDALRIGPRANVTVGDSTRAAAAANNEGGGGAGGAVAKKAAASAVIVAAPPKWVLEVSGDPLVPPDAPASAGIWWLAAQDEYDLVDWLEGLRAAIVIARRAERRGVGPYATSGTAALAKPSPSADQRPQNPSRAL
ncbi:hypothetical protein HK405_005061 [Cladochytrium tenue]|nr:hypothetical protein HK405_005061 [Cladochytrium tenue]